MSHLDEGTLHALLDGELATNEVAEIQAHLGACSACGLRLREVKEFLSESDRLIASVDMGDAQTPQPEPRPRPRPPARAPVTEPWNEPPPLLMPDNETAADRRMNRLRRLNQAAMLAVVVGIGLVWNNLYRRNSAGLDAAPGDSALNQPTAVVSAAETARPTDSQPSRVVPTAPPEADTQAAAAQARTPPARTQPDPRPPAQTSPAAAEKAAAPAAEQQLADSDSPQNDLQTVDSIAESAGGGNGADTAAAEDIATVRARAAEALADLDRERRRDQAAAATAALDNQRRRRAAAPAPARIEAAAAPAPPPPPTPEQRAGIYLRIGLDEASRQLGAPVHVIEGMVPMFMGLAQGRTVQGADTTRPVVRVVYQDPQGRLILLDQQRLRSGASGFRGSALAWTQGEHALWLHGEPNAEVLRTYRPRVR
ncbi:MAG TPA: zf-HC2 domain-containing protein [Gemmatimonadales bacterium]|nr:zf-HC2 domain-containing protein [Gemmatimonadales bacterium]